MYYGVLFGLEVSIDMIVITWAMACLDLLQKQTSIVFL